MKSLQTRLRDVDKIMAALRGTNIKAAEVAKFTEAQWDALAALANVEDIARVSRETVVCRLQAAEAMKGDPFAILHKKASAA